MINIKKTLKSFNKLKSVMHLLKNTPEFKEMKPTLIQVLTLIVAHKTMPGEIKKEAEQLLEEII